MTSTRKIIRNVRLFAMGVAEASRKRRVPSRWVAVAPNYLSQLPNSVAEASRKRRGRRGITQLPHDIARAGLLGRLSRASRRRRGSGALRWGLLAPLGPILPPTHTPSATTAHWNQKHLKPTSLHCFVTCLELLWLAATRNEAFTKPGPAWPFKSFQNACESS